MRILTYWKDVPIHNKPWATFQLVPLQTITEQNSGKLFEDMLAIVRRSGFNYQVIEVSEKMVESSDNVI